MNEKIKLGVLALSLLDYDKSMPGLKDNRVKWLKSIIKDKFQDFDVYFTQPCNTREQIENCIKEHEYNYCDALLVVFLTYGTSVTALPGLNTCKIPIIIWNTQEAYSFPLEAMYSNLIDNHGVHGVQDLCSVLNRCGKKFHVITCHHSDTEGIKELKSMLRTSGIKNCLQRSQIGLLGYAMQDMGDFYFDELSFMAKVGPHVIHIPIDELAEEINFVQTEEVNELIKQNKDKYSFTTLVTQTILEENYRVEVGIKRLIEKYRLDGWSQFFSPVMKNKSIKTPPFFAACRLMAEGISYAAEGDISAAASGIILNYFAGISTLSEMFTMDFKDSCFVMSHMGEVNISMARKDKPVTVTAKDFSWGAKHAMSPLVPMISLEPGEATLLSIVCLENGSYRFVTVEGEVLDFPHEGKIDSPVFKFKTKRPLKEFFELYCEAGGTHHHSMAYGNYATNIKLLGKMLDVEVINI